MKIIAIIPARYESTRFPGKPLIEIAGISMIERVYNQVQESNKINQILVATDDIRIHKKVFKFGGKAVMTSKDHKSGTDRIWEVVKDLNCDGIINIQGDEPMISPHLINRVYTALLEYPQAVISAASKNYSYSDFLSNNIIKVIFDKSSYALYFSRSPIPFMERQGFSYFYHHYGIYGYSKKLLEFFYKTPQSDLEKKEKLEQLRFLEHSKSIYILRAKEKSYGVDTIQDKDLIEKMINKKSD